MEEKTFKLVTHNRDFHLDDIFACAVLSLLAKKQGAKYTVVRTRDEGLIASGDIVFDVGGIYDPATMRFDHHQKGGAGVRTNGIPYASFGLVWKNYGDILTGNAEITEKIDKRMCQPIDADDNGVATYTQTGDVSPYSVRNLFYAFRTTWKEDEAGLDAAFLKLVAFAEEVITREIITARDNKEAESIVEQAYQDAPDKRLIVLETSVPAEDVLMKYPEPLFIIRPNSDGSWRMVGVSAKNEGFERRKNMPTAWSALRDAELEKVTGVPGAVFCHAGLWLIVAKSKDAILALAKQALEA